MSRRRRSPLDLAVLCIFLLLLAGGLANLFRGETEPEAPLLPPGISAIRVFPAMDRLESDEGFTLELEISKNLYVAAWLLYEGAPPERLFPPLGAPPGLPWPLTGQEGGKRWTIPGGDRRFFRRRDEPGFLVVFAREQGEAFPAPELLDQSDIEKDLRSRHQHFIPFERRTR